MTLTTRGTVLLLALSASLLLVSADYALDRTLPAVVCFEDGACTDGRCMAGAPCDDRLDHLIP